MVDASARTGGPHTPFQKVVDESGFPFQLAIEHRLRSFSGSVGPWTVVPEFATPSGFVDVVATWKHITLVIECKRLDDKCFFLITRDEAAGSVARCHLEWHRMLQVGGRRTDRVFVEEFTHCESSAESGFCVMKRDDKGSKNMMESLAKDVVAHCHALAFQDQRTREYGFEVFVPVLVTNAELYTCQFEPTGVDLASGRLSTDGQFKEAEFVRFRKSFTTVFLGDIAQPTYSETAEDTDRTVFVVRPNALNRFLNGFRAFNASNGRPLPDACA